MEALAPFRQRERLPATMKSQAPFRVPCLLNWCCPEAIRRLVIAVAILSFYGMPCGWAWSHILEEYHEVIPASAYLDPSATVFLISAVGLVMASASHGLPWGVGRVRLGAPMGAEPRPAGLVVKATATPCSSAHNGGTDDHAFLAAVATTDPPRLPGPRALFMPSKYVEASEPSAGKLDYFGTGHAGRIPNKLSVSQGCSVAPLPISYSDT